MRDIHAFNQVIRKLRSFFQDELGYVEVPAQARLSILAACEDPSTISVFEFSKTEYPLPQTGQMWLEYEILNNPDVPGVFCSTTSYRNEPNPIPGRHDKVFPMFEFESKGNLDQLRETERKLLKHLGFPEPVSLKYEDACAKYSVQEITATEEEKIEKDFGKAVSLEFFPQRTQPFWNMKHGKDGIYNKIDVLLHGMETIGSAERATDKKEMYEGFLSISEGQYAELLFKKFGKDRVMRELDEYLSMGFFERFGAGIGVTRLARAMQLSNLLETEKKEAA